MSNQYKTRMLFLEYFATGEGLHVYIFLAKTTSEEITRERFKEHFIKSNGEEYYNYLEGGFEYSESINEKILSKYCSELVVDSAKNNKVFSDLYFEINFCSPL